MKLLARATAPVVICLLSACGDVAQLQAHRSSQALVTSANALFIGNSLTAMQTSATGEDLPAVLARLASSQQKTLTYKKAIDLGHTLQDSWDAQIPEPFLTGATPPSIRRRAPARVCLRRPPRPAAAPRRARSQAGELRSPGWPSSRGGAGRQMALRSGTRSMNGPERSPMAAQALCFRNESTARSFRDRRIPMTTFIERYIDGSIDVSGDLHELLRERAEWVNYRFTWEQAKFLITKFVPSLLVHSKAADRSFVVDHYDRGNDFFEAFLGDSMVYTSARFASADDSLEAAQERKIRDVGEKLQLQAGDRLLDIGCGWGTLVANLAEQFGVDATGVTLSKNQTELASQRIRARGLERRARVLTLDYRDIPGPAYDKISCLEMAEHVGVKNFQKYLRQVSGLLDDDGLFFLQIVGLRRPPELGFLRNDRGGYWDASDFTWAMFMSRYIFPGADASLPLSFVAAQFEKAGFEIRSVENINVHYGMTIHRWYQNWMRNREKVIAAYGERWYRLWHLFLAWSVFTGVEGRGDCLQIVAHKSRRSFDRYRFVGPAKRAAAA